MPNLKVDPVKLEIFKSMYASVAEEMGTVMRRTAFSPNIKERRDYSCAVFDRRGQLIAQGDHMPVHLGSMPMSVSAALATLKLDPGDVVLLNDPYAGGTHLPDVTMVAPVYSESVGKPKSKKNGNQKLLFYVANRAHHADIGGATPGSMGPATEIYAEGLRIPPVKIIAGNQLQTDMMRLILNNLRMPEEREGDLTAQLGAIRTGQARLLEIVGRYGFAEADQYARNLIDYTARMMESVISEIPDGEYSAEDFLDNDGHSDQPVRIAVKITIKGKTATIDFTGSSPQVNGPINAVEAITISATYYVFRCLIPLDVPASAGILAPLKFIIPEGTIVNARPPAAVAGGNVETSQRTVDTLFKALAKALPNHIPAASQGTMNNLTMGGMDPRTGRQFAYYETVAGGMGARPGLDGISAVHTHMTNSLNTPAEALEYSYPMRVRRYEIRRGSGGKGKWKGGDGIIREIEILTDAKLSLLSDRRKIAPYGLMGGDSGALGKAFLESGGERIELDGKASVQVKAGDVIIIESPGGGGYGKLEEE
ncbi:MAG TPA: hydantoinase B/oxoprolinase family protein [Blastocatellia bacterium]|nr:hydantoinase B/oxoprolinase family protein [Blastocatellia bacterium]